MNKEPIEANQIVGRLEELNEDLRQVFLHARTCFSAITKLHFEPGIIDGLASLGADQCEGWQEEVEDKIAGLIDQVKAMENELQTKEKKHEKRKH